MKQFWEQSTLSGDISTSDEEMKSFLFSLGCYSGEPITVVSRKKRTTALCRLRTDATTLILI